MASNRNGWSPSRREMMKLTAGALLAAGLWPGRLRAADAPTKPLKFIVVNDLHYTQEASAPFFEDMVKRFNEVEKAAFVLVAGDIVEPGGAAQCQAMHAILSKCRMPFHVTCGNNDAVSQTDRSPFERVFGSALNFHFEMEGWQVVGMDTSDGTRMSNVDCRKETLDFAASLPGKLDKNKPTFVFTHFPLGPGVTNRLRNADTLLAPLKELNVQAIFTGHHHGFTEKQVLTNVLVTTNCCCAHKRANHDGKFQKGFFVIEAAEGKYKRRFVDFGTDYPGSATPRNRPLPTTRPAAPEDPDRPWW